MDGVAAASSLGVLLQILFLDLLLSGDNALVIALACRRLPPEQARRAAWLGALGAILFRLILTLMTGVLMRLPFLQLLSALPLLVIALNLMQGEEQPDDELASAAAKSGILAAAGIIVVSDATMSLDNVVALAAVSGGSFWLLAFGLALTIPLIVFGSFGFSRLMQVFPLLVDAGSALLGWVAGGMIINDPLVADWVRTQAPAVGVALPLACAIFVLGQGRLARAREQAAPEKARGSVCAFGTQVEKTRENSGLKPITDQKKETLQPRSAPLSIENGSAPTPQRQAEPVEAEEGGDRWMIIGLVALFAVFGLFLTFVVMLPDN
jgi:YjbE family integral membrane protein